MRDKYLDLIENGADSVINEWGGLDKDGGLKEQQSINWAISDMIMYYEDQATILHEAMTRGVVRWGEVFDWCDVEDMIWEDIWDEVQDKVGQQQGDEGDKKS